MGHFRPSCSIDVDGDLSPNSFRAGLMPPTVKEGQLRTPIAIKPVADWLILSRPDQDAAHHLAAKIGIGLRRSLNV